MSAIDREAYRPRRCKAKPSSNLHYLLVQAYQPLSLVYFHGLYRRFTYVHHTSYLALTRFCGYQEGTLLTICTPYDCSYFVPLSGLSLFKSLYSSGGTDGSLSLFNGIGTTPSSNLVSHWPKSSVATIWCRVRLKVPFFKLEAENKPFH